MHPEVLVVLRRLVMVVSALVSIIIEIIFRIISRTSSFFFTFPLIGSHPALYLVCLCDVGVQLLDAIQVA